MIAETFFWIIFVVAIRAIAKGLRKTMRCSLWPVCHADQSMRAAKTDDWLSTAALRKG